jgi:hypothetical protein
MPSSLLFAFGIVADLLLVPSCEAEDQRWWIPLQLLSDAPELSTRVIFSEKSHKIAHKAGDFWVKANAGQSGVFRIRYDDSLFPRVVAAASAKLLPAVDRLGVLDDTFALAESGHIPTSRALELALSYIGEDDTTVWSTIGGRVSYLLSAWLKEPTSSSLRSLTRKLFSPIAASLGWEKRPAEGAQFSLLSVGLKLTPN